MSNAYDPKWLAREMDKRKVRTGRLADLSGVSRSQIQRIRKGMAPRMDTLNALNTALSKLPCIAPADRPADTQGIAA